MSEENQVITPEEETEQTEQDIHVLKKIRIDKLDELKAAGKNPYEITKYDVTILNAELRKAYEESEAKAKAEAGDDEEKLKAALEASRINVRIAGRIMSWRDMGKANFIDVRDGSDRMQVYVRMNDIGADEFAEFKKWEIGRAHV